MEVTGSQETHSGVNGIRHGRRTRPTERPPSVIPFIPSQSCLVEFRKIGFRRAVKTVS
jgi:hypothetical protein